MQNIIIQYLYNIMMHDVFTTPLKKCSVFKLRNRNKNIDEKFLKFNILLRLYIIKSLLDCLQIILKS